MPQIGSNNNVSALVPEVWAAESLMVLEEQMVIANLVHRDFEDAIANFGDTVHAHRPSEFEAKRKNEGPVTTQPVVVSDVPVVLNQWPHVSFFLRDGEESKSFKVLAELHLQPALSAMSRIYDQVLCAQSVQFLTNAVGGLGTLTELNAKSRLIDTRKKMQDNKVPTGGRGLMLGSAGEAAMLNTDLFVSAEKVGDDGTALREANLGRKFQFNTFQGYNTPLVSGADTGTAGTASAAARGSSSIVSDVEIAAGQYFTVVGDMSPLRAAAVVAGTAAWTVATTRPTIGAIAGSAVLTPYTTGATTAAYDAGHVTEIRVNTAATPQVGQMVAFSRTGVSVDTTEYVIIQVTDNGSSFDILLDRPLVNALEVADTVNYGPNGEYNFAFHRNAVALVSRPLVLPQTNLANAAVAEYNGIAVRVVITYDGLNQGHRVTIDSLFGVAVLDVNLGAVLLG